MNLEPQQPSDSPGSVDSAIDRPRRLHPTSLLFLVLASARQSLVPVVVAGYSAVKGSWIGMVIACGIVGTRCVGRNRSVPDVSIPNR